MNEVPLESHSAQQPAPARRSVIFLRRSAWVLSALVFLAWLTFDHYEVRGNSMQPLLIDRKADSDQLIACTAYYRFFTPQRFDLAIFERPRLSVPGIDAANVSNDRCIKRLFGLPGERPLVDGGDVFLDVSGTNGGTRQRLRRPPAVIESMLTVVGSLYTARTRENPWLIPAAAKLELDGVSLCAAPSEGNTTIQYDALIKNDWIDDAGRAFPGGEIVNDVGVEAEITWHGSDSRVIVELREQADLFRWVIERTGSYVVERRRGPAAELQRIAERSDPIQPLGSRTRLRFLNVDDQLLLWIDGNLLATIDYDGNEEVLGPWSNGPSLGVNRGCVSIHELRVVRDAFYTGSGIATGALHEPKAIPEGSYFFLGDNSSNSIDSRDFGPVRAEELKGRPLLRYRPGEGFTGL